MTESRVGEVCETGMNDKMSASSVTRESTANTRMDPRQKMGESEGVVVGWFSNEQPGLYMQNKAERGLRSWGVRRKRRRGQKPRGLTERTNSSSWTRNPDYPRPHKASKEQSSNSPRIRRAVSIANVASLIAFRGLLFTMTDFMISTQCFAHILDLSGVS